MLTKDFKSYIDGADITKIPAQNLSYPSKNVIIHKGKVFTRLGISYMSAPGTTNNEIHSEFVWGDSKSGEMALRGTSNKIQAWLEPYKTGAGWVDIFTGIDTTAKRVEFATWTDGNTAIIKRRLFMVDGGKNIYQWNGGVAVVQSIAGAVITIEGTKTLQQLGFDDGTTTLQTVLINGTAYTYSYDPTTTSLALDTIPAVAPVQGDLIIVQPLTHSGNLPNFDKNHIYDYKNQVVIASLSDNQLFFSDVATYSMATGLDFTVPTTKTATTPMYFTLDANITAMKERKGILWVSTVDGWFKITKLYSANGAGDWATVEKVESANRVGAIPYAVSSHKGDMIFIAQDSTVQTISDLIILQTDRMKLISDDIEDLLLRYDLTDSRIYYNGRYIYITVPAESSLVMLDVVEDHWQPPQILPISRFSFIEGRQVGHSNNTDESFYLFDGTSDLGSEIESVIAFGYQGYTTKANELEYKWYDTFGISGRMSLGTTCTVDVFFETDGAKSSQQIVVDSEKIKTYSVSDDVSWATHPFATRSWAGGNFPAKLLKRFFVFDKIDPISFFEWRPIFTIVGVGQQFQLLAFSVNVALSDRTREDTLFITK